MENIFSNNYCFIIRNNFWEIRNKIDGKFSEHLMVYCFLQVNRGWGYGSKETAYVRTSASVIANELPFLKKKSDNRERIRKILLNLELCNMIELKYAGDELENDTTVLIKIESFQKNQENATVKGFQNIPHLFYIKCLGFDEYGCVSDVDSDEFAIMCYIRKREIKDAADMEKYNTDQSISHDEIADYVGISNSTVQRKIRKSNNIIKLSNGWEEEKTSIRRKKNTFIIGDKESDDVLSKFQQKLRWKSTSVKLTVEDFMCYLKNCHNDPVFDQICEDRFEIMNEKVRSDLMNKARNQRGNDTRAWREIPDWNEEEEEASRTDELEEVVEEKTTVEEVDNVDTSFKPFVFPKTQKEIEEEEKRELYASLWD